MKPKPKLRLKPRAPKLTHAQIEQILSGQGYAPSTAHKTPPLPPPAAPSVAFGEGGPILWNFSHTHPQLPNAILHCVVEAPTIHEARGKAYLLAENFAQNVIGRIKAGT